jgi:hypothetical protein
MSAARIAACAILLSLGAPAGAHRLDEYLQATTIAIERDRVEAQVRLVPGIEVFAAIIPAVDIDRDGVVSAAEQRAYAERVQRDLRLTVDGTPLELRLISSAFPPIHTLQEGTGEIELRFEARAPHGAGGHRKLVFENRHEPAIGAYLVNVLVPDDPQLRVAAQSRNYPQSLYELDYVLADTAPGAGARSSRLYPSGWLDLATILVVLAAAVLVKRLNARYLR